jgi:NitT/TauT family transport system substrate-binding protein
MMRLRLYENYRFLLYAPFYAAQTTGAYAAEGLEVEMTVSPGTGRAEEDLLRGAVDVIWAGPMRVIKQHDLYPDSPLVCFAEIVCRDPFSIVGGRPAPDFRLTDLARLRFASVSEVPTPWLCLQQDLREAGVDPARLDRIADRSMGENLEALARGEIDAVQLFEPFVEQALAAGTGHLWYAASSRGRTTYTAFVTTRERLQQIPDRLTAMVRAMQRTQQWLRAASPGDIAAAIGSFFPAIEPSTLAGALARYRAQGVWGEDPLLPADGFEQLEKSLRSSGFTAAPVFYEACVDNRLARTVVAALV